MRAFHRQPGFPDHHYDDDSAYFDDSNRIVYVDQGLLKRCDIQGGGTVVLSQPEAPYKYGIFWMSPDRQKVMVLESRSEGGQYPTGHYGRLVLLNADGSGRSVVLPEFPGDYNQLFWNSDGTAFFFYYHALVTPEYPAQYVLGTWNGGGFDLTPLTTPGIWDVDPNLCCFTPQGNLLGWFTRKLYRLEEGSTEDRSFEMPEFTASSRARIGYAQDGRTCFADGDGSNFRWFLGENPLHLTMSRAGNQAFQLSWNALPGQSYIVEGKETLALPFAEVTRDILGSTYTIGTATNPPTRFYRVRPH